MTIILTREEAQQLLEVFELFLEEAEDVTTLENNLVKMLRVRLSAPEPELVAKWEPQVERRYSPDGVLLSEKVKYTPDGEWRDLPKWRGLSTAEVNSLWNLTKKPTEFAEMLQAKLKEKNAANA